MKIALCLFGHLRTFRDCWDSLNQNLIIPNNITDIFGMIWMDSTGSFQHPDSSKNPMSHSGYDVSSPSVDIAEIIAITNALKFKGLHFDNFFLHKDRFESLVREYIFWSHPNPTHRPIGTFSQIWGRSAALKLVHEYEMANNFSYDQIVCTRWDILYNAPILLSSLCMDEISTDGMFGPDVISDAWTCGSSNLMNLWSTQFDTVGDLAKKSTLSLGPHEWLQAHFAHRKIKWSDRSDIISISIKR